MRYIRESILEIKKSVFPTRNEMKKNMIVVLTTIITSSLLLYGVGVLVLEIFSKIYN